MNKSRHVTFRCTQDQYDRIKCAAKANNLTVSELILASMQYAADCIVDWYNQVYGGKRVNIWKQQQDLKQPDEQARTDWRRDHMKKVFDRIKPKMSSESRKLNQELLRQYQEKVAEIEKLLES